MPTTSPQRSSTGPPELPGCRLTVVCSRWMPTALTWPVVSDHSSSPSSRSSGDFPRTRGWPMATSSSPMMGASSRTGSSGTPSGDAGCSRATSAFLSNAAISARTNRRSAVSRTRSPWGCTTCHAVATRPPATANPVPDASRPWIRTTDGCTRA